MKPGLILVCIWLGLCTAQTPSNLFDLAWHDHTVFKLGLTTSGQESLAGLNRAPVYHLEWQLSEDLTQLSGKAEMLITHQGPKPWSNLVFRLYPNALGSSMTVNHIQVDGVTVTSSLESQNTALRIPLPHLLESGQSVVVAIQYHLTISDTIQAYGRLAKFENALSLAHAFPTLSIPDSQAWHTDFPDDLGDPLVAEAAFYMVKVIAPAAYTLVTSGQQFQHSIEGNKQITEYLAGPSRDFYLAALKDYVVSETTIGETRVRSFLPQHLAHALERSQRTAIQAIEFFSTYYPYPYREFDVVAIPVEAGGVEYPGLINITNSLFNNSFGRLSTVIAHEVAHQWSYNLVGSDQIEHPWLDESLTQYLTLRYQETYEPDFAQGYMDFWQQLWRRSQNPDQPIGLPVTAYNESSYGEIVYGKGLFFFKALSEHIGKESLDHALRVYFQQFAWQFAKPAQFQKVLEDTCQCQLNGLFETWVTPQ